MVYLGKIGNSADLGFPELLSYALQGTVPDWRQETPCLRGRIDRREQTAEGRLRQGGRGVNRELR